METTCGIVAVVMFAGILGHNMRHVFAIHVPHICYILVLQWFGNSVQPGGVFVCSLVLDWCDQNSTKQSSAISPEYSRQ